MKKILLSSILAITAGSAFAADLPRKSYAPSPVMAPVPMSWQGGYIGAFGGGSVTSGLTGPLYGVQAGYDWQNGPIVYGIVGDIAAANARGRYAGVPGGSYVNTVTGSVRGRLGYAISPAVLVYGTAGVGFNNFKSYEYTTPSTASATTAGLTGGVGAEFKFDRNWSLFGEYRATHIGNKSFSTVVPTSISGTTHDLRAGVNYRF